MVGAGSMPGLPHPPDADQAGPSVSQVLQAQQPVQ